MAGGLDSGGHRLNRNSGIGLVTAVLAAVPATFFVPTVGWAQIEEIIVTTRKRTESLQDVPIAVDALTAEMIQRQGITNVADVVKFSSSVQFDTSYNPTDTRVNIRGLSATRGRSNVAFLVDGIDVTTENVISAGSGLLANQRLLNDVERIEIVKGSQSALYGRSAFSGAISYITKEPGDEFEGDLQLEVAEDGYIETGAAFGGPIIQDVLGMRLNGVYWSDDGQYTNSVSGNDVGGGDGWGTSLVTVYTPTERLRFKARVEYSSNEFDVQPIVRLAADTPNPYPESAYLVGLTGGTSRDLVNSDAGNSQSGSGATTESTVTLALRDHGLYCNEVLPPGLTRDERQLALKQIFPDYPTVSDDFLAQNFPGIAPADVPLSLQPLSDGSQPLVPGICHAQFYGNADGKAVQLSEDGLTGEQYKGTESDIFRGSVLGTWDFDYGSYSANAGYTDATSKINQDQDYQTIGWPDTGLSQLTSKSKTDTEQTSVELRFASAWEDSPVQLTVGGLWWHEERTVNDEDFIISCIENSRIGNTLYGESIGGPDVDGLCDGELGTLDNWQDMLQQLQPHSPAKWKPEIDHKSAYFMVEWSLTDQWNVTLENRYVNDKQDLSKPNFSSCGYLTFGIAAGNLARIAPWLDEAQNPGFDARCTSDQFDTSNGSLWFSQLPTDIQALYEAPSSGDVLLPGFPLLDANVNADCVPLGVDPNCVPYGNISGSETSRYNTPKVTLEFMATDDAMLYFFWARAQKPSGINAISSGGAATTIAEERFDAEKMDSYELGWKTAWEASGFLQVNGAVFFQDYTDKQVGTQILVSDGQGGFRANPRVINASSAEVWGLELELTWQPEFLEGLTMFGSYTYLDTQYSDFVDETTTFARSATAGDCPVVWKDGSKTIATGVTDPNLDPDLYPVADRTYDPLTGNLNSIYAPKCALDLTGNELERAPKNAFVANINLTRPLGSTGADWFTQLNAFYQGDRFADADNYVKYDDYWTFDYQLGLTNEKIDVLFYIDNLFDDDTLKSGGFGPDFGPGIRDRGFPAGLVQLDNFGSLPEQRRFGVRLNYRFQ
jgi:outer membrane receptor protein involved in Fe transport